MPPSPAPPPLVPPAAPRPASVPVAGDVSVDAAGAAVGPRRRPLLAGALGVLGALGLAGCSGGSGDPKAAERSPEALRLRETAARRSRSLLARYDATLAEHSALGERLAPLRAAVASHATAFGGRTESGRTEKGGGKGEAPPEVPGEEKAALDALAGAERRTASAHTEALVTAPPELARTLASMAAACAAHAYLLGQSEGGTKDEGDKA